MCHVWKNVAQSRASVRFCESCGVGFSLTGRWPEQCPMCHAATVWMDLPLLRLTDADRRLLKHLKIAAD